MHLQTFYDCASSAFPLLDRTHTPANEGHTWVWGSLDGLDDFFRGCEFDDPLTVWLFVPGFDVSHLTLETGWPTSGGTGIEVDNSSLVAFDEVHTLVYWSKHELGGTDAEVSNFLQAGIIFSLESGVVVGVEALSDFLRKALTQLKTSWQNGYSVSSNPLHVVNDDWVAVLLVSFVNDVANLAQDVT